MGANEQAADSRQGGVRSDGEIRISNLDGSSSRIDLMASTVLAVRKLARVGPEFDCRGGSNFRCRTQPPGHGGVWQTEAMISGSRACRGLAHQLCGRARK